MVNNYTHSNRREKWGIGVLGELLQELRKDKGMTQAELAAKLELSPLTVSSYECGRSAPDDETKVKIAEIFDVSVDYLLGLIRIVQHQYDRQKEKQEYDTGKNQENAS